MKGFAGERQGKSKFTRVSPDVLRDAKRFTEKMIWRIFS
jgi:hypothetical protein